MSRGNANNGGREFYVNLKGNFNGNIDISQSQLGNFNNAFFRSEINLGTDSTGQTFKGNLRASVGRNVINFKGKNDSSNVYNFQGIMTLTGGVNTVNVQNTSFYTRTNGDKMYQRNTAPIVIQGGTNTFNFKEHTNIYGQVYITNGTNRFQVESSSNFYMAGDINVTGGDNIFVFKNSNNITPVLAGNIIVSGGRTTVLFDNTAWLSASYRNSADSALRNDYSAKFLNLNDSSNMDNSDGRNRLSNLTGNITTRAQGQLDVVFKYSQELLQGDRSITYNVTTAGGSGANIVLDTSNLYSGSGSTSPLTFTTNLAYAGRFDPAGNYVWTGSGNSGAINLFLAQGVSGDQNMNATDFGAANSVNQRILGQTYNNGLRLEFTDRNVNVRNSSRVSFVGANKDAILAKVNKDGYKTNLLSVKFETGKEMANNGRTNTVTLTGVAVGTIYSLNAYDAISSSQTKTSTYNMILDKHSVFFGGVNFSSFAVDASAPNQDDNRARRIKFDLTLKEGSKLIVPGSMGIDRLNIENANIHEDQLVQNIFTQDNTIIDLGSNGNDLNGITRRQDFNLLQIGTSSSGNTQTTNGLSGSNAVFRVYANARAAQSTAGSGETGAKLNNVAANGGTGTYGYVYSDRVLVREVVNGNSNSSSTPLTEYVQVITDSGNDVSGVRYHGGGTEVLGNVAVFTVKNLNSGMAGVDLRSTSAIAGFDELSSSLTAVKTDINGKTNGNNNNGWTTYFVDTLTSGITAEDRSATMSALTSGYNVFLANLNSLNKRMGELRDNPYGNGLWARFINGMQSNYYAQDTSTVYTNLQAGFDHAFGGNGSNNYTGFALSYVNGVSFSKDMQRKDGSLAGLGSGVSNGFEIALYNSYVNDGARAQRWDKGFYNDNILKFSAIFTSVNMLNGNTDGYTNLGISFSEELGYRFLLGKHNNWYIDPQAEVALAYLSGSQVNQVSGGYYLRGSVGSISMLRGRVGSSFGYYFDQFTQDKGFKSKLYLGLFYEGDLVGGGDVALNSNLSSIDYTITSTSRMVLNLGTNFTVKDNHRIYFDFQRSFFGKIVTDYQLNVGYRYSFGSTKYTPLENTNMVEAGNDAKVQEVAPTAGYYIKLLSTKNPSKKENRILSKVENLKTQNNGNTKSYLVGPFR